ncbi:hypothetical protein ACFVZC_17060 [Streptomyces marokkonensis]|uniref:Uncharacterized protein n=1 Tax=Streptomyces marokkonensis TaxID=324855 RepID=A0ABW6Q7C3_9ACTN
MSSRSAPQHWPTPTGFHCIRTGAPLNEPDPATSYGGDHRGYTDYPALTTTAARRSPVSSATPVRL